MGLPTRHQPRLCVTPNLSKMGFRYANLSFFGEILTKKTLKGCYVFHCQKTSSGKVVARLTTYRTVSTFWQGMLSAIADLVIEATQV